MNHAVPTIALLLAGTTTAFAQEALEADADGDGLLSLAEFDTLYSDLTDAALAEEFALVDIDGDGLLDAEEIALARERGVFPPAG